jgi:cyclopropane-fatty-acyl-phospholipid synthase
VSTAEEETARGAPESATIGRLAAALSHLLDAPLPFQVRSWDGAQTLDPADSPVLVVRSSRALRRILWQPDRLGLARAWVAGDVDVDGDLADFLVRLMQTVGLNAEGLRPSGEARADLMSLSVLLGAVGPHPAPPAAEYPSAGADAGADDTSEDAPDAESDTPQGDAVHQVLFGGRGEGSVDQVLGASRIDAVGHWRSSDPPGAVEAVSSRLVNSVADRVAGVIAKQPHPEVWDVAPGWGGLGVELASRLEIPVTCVALSQVQCEAITGLAAARDVADRVRVRVATAADAGSDEPDLDVMLATSLAVPPVRPGQDQRLTDPVRRRRLRRREEPTPELEPGALAWWGRRLRRGGLLVAQRLVRLPHTGATDAPGEDVVPPWLAASYPVPAATSTTISQVVTDLERAGLTVSDLRTRSSDAVRSCDAWLTRQRASLAAAPDPGDRVEGMARAWALALALLDAQVRVGRYRVMDVVATRDDPEVSLG